MFVCLCHQLYSYTLEASTKTLRDSDSPIRRIVIVLALWPIQSSHNIHLFVCVFVQSRLYINYAKKVGF